MEESFMEGFVVGLEKIAKKRKEAKDDEEPGIVGPGEAVLRGAGAGVIPGGVIGIMEGAKKYEAKREVRKPKGRGWGKPPKGMGWRKGHVRGSGERWIRTVEKKRPTKRRIIGGLKGAGVGAAVGGGLGALLGPSMRNLMEKRKKKKKD